MKSSLRRLRGALQRNESKLRRDARPLGRKNDLAQASQEMQGMKDCYDGLLSAAAATANSAYEFSESLRELGCCLLEKTALNDDEESGKALLTLGKTQFELQKLLDDYRSHIFQTITIPSDSLLNELRTVEEMKRQCDDKRNVYEYMLLNQREKGRLKAVKEKSFSMQQIQEAHDEYDEEATLFFFRLKSLKQGQNRCLLTQAARHHAAQLSFFRKALKSLEEVEPHVKQVTEHQHIDYHFSGLEDEEGGDETDNNDEDDSETHDEGDLSFDYRENDKGRDAVSTAPNPVELGFSDTRFPQVARANTAKELLRYHRNSFSIRAEPRAISQSAPLYVENNISHPSEKLLRTRSTRKFNSYVLPTPVEAMTPRSIDLGKTVFHTPRASTGSIDAVRWPKHSSFLDPKTDVLEDAKNQSLLRESNQHTASFRFPRRLSEGLLDSRLNQPKVSDFQRMRRQSFSGPLTSKQRFNYPASVEVPHVYSGPILQNPITRLPMSPSKVSSVPDVSSPSRLSPSVSPTIASSPRIRELHELPRPPNALTWTSSRVSSYSAPLPVISNSESLLPKPSSVIRSFSIPSNNLKAPELDVSEASKDAQKSDFG